jgi:hypothetical protein
MTVRAVQVVGLLLLPLVVELALIHEMLAAPPAFTIMAHLTGAPSSIVLTRMDEMPRKRKKRKFSAIKAVKANAREVLGSPRPTRREENPKNSKIEKHKPTLGSLLSDS